MEFEKWYATKFQYVYFAYLDFITVQLFHSMKFIYLTNKNCMTQYIYNKGYLPHWIEVTQFRIYLPLKNDTCNRLIYGLTFTSAVLSAVRYTSLFHLFLYVFNQICIFLYCSYLKIVQMTVFGLITIQQRNIFLSLVFRRDKQVRFSIVTIPYLSLLKASLISLHALYHF